MCGRYTRYLPWSEIHRLYRLTAPADVGRNDAPRYNDHHRAVNGSGQPDVNQIHDRQPIMLDPAYYDAWLDPKTHSGDLKDILSHDIDGPLQFYRLGRDARHDAHSLIRQTRLMELSVAQQLTDPADGLASFQQALADGEIYPQRCKLDPDLYMLVDQPAGSPRLTYARIDDDSTVTAIAILAVAEPMEGLPCFQLGYAVPQQYRNQGRAKEVVKAALAELQHGFANANVRTFLVEAVVGADNPVSQAVAAATCEPAPWRNPARH